MDIMVTNNQLAGRFEIGYDNNMAFLEYIVIGDVMTLVHTEVPGELGGKGFGGKLVESAHEHAKKNNLQVIAYCEFANSYIKTHYL